MKFHLLMLHSTKTFALNVSFKNIPRIFYSCTRFKNKKHVRLSALQRDDKWNIDSSGKWWAEKKYIILVTKLDNKRN